jgi:hypothetical protein
MLQNNQARGVAAAAHSPSVQNFGIHHKSSNSAIDALSGAEEFFFSDIMNTRSKQQQRAAYRKTERDNNGAVCSFK